MAIDQKFLKKLLGVEKTQPRRCVPKVWDTGVQILRLAGPRSWMIELYVKAAGKKAGVPMDWHWAGGRAVVLTMPGTKGKAMAALMELMPTFEEAARRARARGDESAYEVQILEWNGARPPKPEEFPPGAIAWDPALNMFMFEDKSR